MINKRILGMIVFLCAVHSTSLADESIQLKKIQAIENNDLKTLVSLLEINADLEGPIETYGSLLQFSTYKENIPITRFLIEQDADVDSINEQKKVTPLHIATAAGNTKLVKLLLENNANPNSQNQRGRTPLFSTIVPERSDIRNLLISYGANVALVDRRGRTLLEVALIAGNELAKSDIQAQGIQIDEKTAATIANGTRCAHCHNNYRKGPHLGGQHSQYTEKQLKDFRDGRRHARRMDSQLKFLQDDELIEKLSLHYEKQTRIKIPSHAEPELLKIGKQIYLDKCASCHGLDGITTSNKLTPVIAGMKAVYVSEQLLLFKNGVRNNDSEKYMRLVATQLSQEQIEHVAQYTHSLQP